MKELKTAEDVLADKMLIAINEKAVITNRGTGDKYAAKECAKIAIAYAAQEKGWISVEERLLKEYCEVLALCEGNRYVLWFSGDKYYMHLRPKNFFEDWTEYVTHWQPLPPKPGKE